MTDEICTPIFYDGKEYQIMQDVVPAPRDEDSQCNYKLPFGYSINFDKTIFLFNNNESEVEAALIFLKKNNEIIERFYVAPEFITNKLKLFEYIKKELKKYETDENIEWIKKKFCPLSPKDILPWERTEPIRKFRINTSQEQIRDTFLSLSDEGNTRRFTEEVQSDIIFDKFEIRRNTCSYIPYVWIDNHYEQSEAKINLAIRNVMNTIGDYELPAWERIFKMEKDLGKDADKILLEHLSELISALKGHAIKSRNINTQKNMMKMLAGSQLQVSLMDESDFSLIACNNGMLLTDTGEFISMLECEQYKSRYPTVFIPRTFIPGARPEKFLLHLYTIFTDNTTPGLSKDERLHRAAMMAKYFMSLLGYLLVAGNPEQIFVFLYGEGANGKSATIDILDAVLASERADAPINELYEETDDKKPNIVKGLTKRLLTISEASPGETFHRISLSAMKIITGEKSTNNWRCLYSESTKTKINCLPIAITNDKPCFDSELEYSAVRRLVLIPFPHHFKPEERDPNLIREIIETECDEIFSYMVENTRQYLLNGKLPEMPIECQDAANEFLAGEPYASFVNTQLQKTNGNTKEDRLSNDAISVLFRDYCDKNGIAIETRMVFVNGLESLRLKKSDAKGLNTAMNVFGYKSVKVNGVKYWKCNSKNTE